MQLIYRGTLFNYNPAHINARRSVQHSESAYELIYRGNTYQVDPAVATTAPAKPIEYQLIYRGSTYRVNRNEQGEVAIASINSAKHRAETTHPAMQKATGEYLL
ncbi:DUF4278 domain-containing protein [Phormidium tenue FACHB-886]|nr:DUF4278 domain-containing protein [Phormidium tenue FACHB-886]